MRGVKTSTGDAMVAGGLRGQRELRGSAEGPLLRP